MPDPLELCVILIPAVLAAAGGITLVRPQAARRVVLAGMGASCLACCGALAILAIAAEPASVTIEVYHWLSGVNGFPINVPFELHLDRLSALMLTLVTLAGTLTALHTRYDESSSWQPVALSLTVLAAALFLLSANFVQMLFFWQLTTIGTCWLFASECAARPAARKIFLLSAAADIPFVIGMLIVWFNCRSFDSQVLLGDPRLLEDLARSSPATMTTLCLCFLIPAAIRCAQFPLFGWLDDASRASSASNAVLQSAVFMPAAVSLLVRLHPLLVASADARVLLAFLGAMTALLASAVAASETDLKRVLSFSTAAFLGIVFIGLASGSRSGFAAAVLVLLVHALVKTALWLGCGERPSRRWLILVCAVVLTSGFWGQNAVMTAALGGNAATGSRKLETDAAVPAGPSSIIHPPSSTFPLAAVGAERVLTFAGWCVPLATLLTAFALLRVFFRSVAVTTADSRVEATATFRSSAVPAWLAALIAALVAPAVAGPFPLLMRYLLGEPSGSDSHQAAIVTAGSGVGLVAMIVGFTAAWALRARSEGAPRENPFARLARNRFYMTEVVTIAVLVPLRVASQLCRVCDRLIDAVLIGLPVKGEAAAARTFRPLSNGLVQFYGLSIVLAVGVLLATLLWLKS